MFQLASVPEPPVKSTVMVNAVPAKEAITPSMKFAGVATDAALTLCPTAKAVAVLERFVVKALAPVPTATEVVLVRPA
jgi:hypothetical protein